MQSGDVKRGPPRPTLAETDSVILAQTFRMRDQDKGGTIELNVTRSDAREQLAREPGRSVHRSRRSPARLPVGTLPARLSRRKPRGVGGQFPQLAA